MQTAPDIATCMYYTGIDPFTKQGVYIARQLHDRELQRAPEIDRSHGIVDRMKATGDNRMHHPSRRARLGRQERPCRR
jgi:hypothetical protein